MKSVFVGSKLLTLSKENFKEYLRVNPPSALAYDLASSSYTVKQANWHQFKL